MKVSKELKRELIGQLSKKYFDIDLNDFAEWRTDKPEGENTLQAYLNERNPQTNGSKTIPREQLNEFFKRVTPEELADSIDDIVFTYSELISEVVFQFNADELQKVRTPETTTFWHLQQLSKILRTAEPQAKGNLSR